MLCILPYTKSAIIVPQIKKFYEVEIARNDFLKEKGYNLEFE